MIDKFDYFVALQTAMIKSVNDEDFGTEETIPQIKDAPTIGDLICILADEGIDAPCIMYELLNCVVENLDWSDLNAAPDHYST